MRYFFLLVDLSICKFRSVILILLFEGVNFLNITTYNTLYMFNPQEVPFFREVGGGGGKKLGKVNSNWMFTYI